jgi:hypothetical protein
MEKNTEPEMNERIKFEFEKGLQLRNFEIDNFWKRGWFFGALLLASLGGYITIKNGIFPDYAIYISFISFLVSLAQCLMNRGSKYWQERYDYFVKNRESALRIDVTKMQKYGNKEKYYIDASIRSKDENIFTRSFRFSVTKLTFLVWDIVTIFCLFLWLNEVLNFLYPCLRLPFHYSRLMVIIFHFVIGIYILIFVFVKGRVYENLSKSIDDSDPRNNEKNKYFTDMKKYVTNDFSEKGMTQ